MCGDSVIDINQRNCVANPDLRSSLDLTRIQILKRAGMGQRRLRSGLFLSCTVGAYWQRHTYLISRVNVLRRSSINRKNNPCVVCYLFLRRVLYHHIEFPRSERLQEIVDANVQPGGGLDAKLVQAAITHFDDIREHKRLRKRPATAELLAWIHVLHRDRIDLEAGLKASADRDLKQQIMKSYALIAKNREDLETLRRDLGL